MTLLFSTYLKYDISSSFDSIVTFLSIVLGFTITALSIIATSPFSKELYNIEDPKDNSKTLLHQLVYKFRVTTITSILTIVTILIYSFIKPILCNSMVLGSIEICVKSFLNGLISYLIIIAIWRFIALFLLFSKFVIQSAKRQS